MAQIPALISVHIIDAYGIPGQSPYFVTLDDTKTIAQLDTDMSSLITDVAALSQGVVTEVTCLIRRETGIDPTTALGDIEKGGLFNFNNASDSYATGLLIPDINPAVLTSQGLLDLTNAAVTAFITYVTTAHTVVTVVTKGVRALTALRDALITFRKHRKPLARKTTEL